MMAKKLENVEIQEVPAINPVVEIRKKVDAAVKEKIDVAIKGFNDEREEKFVELEKLQSQFDELESKRAVLISERAGLVGGIMGIGVKGVFDLDQKLGWLSKQAEGYQRQIDEIFKKLTDIPKLDFPFLNFLSRWKP